MDNKKIIILASERSGTNLLRTLLQNHRDISGPIASHFFDAFLDTLSDYGDLNKSENSEVLLSHMLLLANHSYHNWQLDDAKPSEMVKKYAVNSFETAFNAMYLEMARTKEKQHYVAKDNNLFHYTPYLNKLDNVKYVYLYRDPRDHVASWMRTPLFMYTPYDIIQKWNKEQRIILKITEQKEVHFVRYESLIENTEVVMSSLLDFIGVSIDQNCFATNAGNKESKRNELWKNLSQPILKGNSKKYKNILSDRDIHIVESLAKPIMETLHYEFDTNADWKTFTGFGYELKLRRVYRKYRNRKFFNIKMANLKDKLELIDTLRREIRAASKK